LQQLAVIFVIRCVGSCEAGGKDPWRTSKRINTDPRIVREYRAGDVGTVMQSFLARVLFKSPAIFDASRKALNSRQRFHMDAAR